ncbi:MAG: DUF1016 N-terminal domain-containing protein [Polaromonas sp.]
MGDQLAQEFGRGFEAKNLRRMLQFAVAFPDAEKVASLMRHLSWTHFLQLLPLKTDVARWFYAQQSVESGWSVRELHHQIERKAFERTELAALQAPAPVLAEPVEANPAQVFKDPYFLDFLGLHQGHDEADLESAILRQLEAFILRRVQPRASRAAANAQRRHHRGRILDRAAAQGRAGAKAARRLAGGAGTVGAAWAVV